MSYGHWSASIEKKICHLKDFFFALFSLSYSFLWLLDENLTSSSIHEINILLLNEFVMLTEENVYLFYAESSKLCGFFL